jgi:hypothetical protein
MIIKAKISTQKMKTRGLEPLLGLSVADPDPGLGAF